MSLALVGSHRTGKSTLAHAFAQKHGIPYVQTGATEVFNILGLDPKADYPIEQRIAIQMAILRAFESQWRDALTRSIYFVSDRSPIDLAGYLLADVTRSTLVGKPEVAAMVNSYVESCIESANRFFGVVVLVQPGIPLIEAPGKAPACPAYMEHLNALYAGLLSRLGGRTYVIKREYVTLEDRIACLERSVSAAQEHHLNSIGRQMDQGIITLH